MGLGLGCGISPRFHSSTPCGEGEVGGPGVGQSEGSFVPFTVFLGGGCFPRVGASFPWWGYWVLLCGLKPHPLWGGGYKMG